MTFESGRSARLAVANVDVAYVRSPVGFPRPKRFGLSDPPDCVDVDEVPYDSLYVNYVDPDGYSWSFAILVEELLKFPLENIVPLP